ncbi:MAG: glycerophosphodiester phosphodiesterase family protein [Leptospiraceae bacterium]|nr:glycerophosphodiester phosphodiesterase family protein [Leptospiraceae bacterium]
MLKLRKTIFYVLVLFLLTECSATHNPRVQKVKEILPQEFLPIGHRGTRVFAPENTLSAFRFAAKLNAGFELDTMQCKTGELVVIHDYTLERTTNGKGKVSDLTLQELKQLDAGSYFIPIFQKKLSEMSLEEIRSLAKRGFIFSKKFKGNVDKMTKEEILALDVSNFLVSEYKGEKIPTLEEVLNEFGGKVPIDIEIKSEKSGEPAVQVGTAVAKLVTEKKLENKVFITSFNPYVLEAVKQTNPNLLRGQIYSSFEDAELAYYKKVILRNLYLNHKAEPDILAMGRELVNPDYVKQMHSYGYKLYPWTVNEPKEMEDFIRYGVDGIISDRVDLVIDVYNKMKVAK